LANATGLSIGDAVVKALRDQLTRTTRSSGLIAELRAISDRCAVLPDLDTRTAEEIIGYDDHGIPAAGKLW
jgi:antitoxin VapB